MHEFIVKDLSKEQLSQDVEGLIQEHAADITAGNSPPAISTDPQNHAKSLVEYVYWLMDRDRKSSPLKSIQGKIWQAGYNQGELKGEVFPDVPAAFGIE